MLLIAIFYKNFSRHAVRPRFAPSCSVLAISEFEVKQNVVEKSLTSQLWTLQQNFKHRRLVHNNYVIIIVHIIYFKVQVNHNTMLVE